MSDMYAVPKEKLDAIVDVINLKRDRVGGMEIDDMPLEIGLIEGGMNIPFAEKMTCGTFIPDDDYTQRLTLIHNLGAIPKFFIIYTNDIDNDSFDGNHYYYKYQAYIADDSSGCDGYKKSFLAVYNKTGTDTSIYRSFGNSIGIYPNDITNEIMPFKSNTPYAFKAGARYHWIAIA